MARSDKYIGRSKEISHRRGSTWFMIIFLSGSLLMIACTHKGSHNQSESNDLTGVTVGDQIWSASNLDVATFRNGDSIPEVKSKEEWEKAGKEGRPAWCYYENDLENGKTYGRMYNWFAMNDPRGLAPEGWHIPTHNEWTTLETFLGVPQAGFKLKCNKGWNDKGNGDSGNGDNSSKLCIPPGGYRGRDGRFSGAGEFLYLSSITEERPEESKDGKTFLWGRGIQFENLDAMRCVLDKEFGLYVRCVKDKR